MLPPCVMMRERMIRLMGASAGPACTPSASCDDEPQDGDGLAPVLVVFVLDLRHRRAARYACARPRATTSHSPTLTFFSIWDLLVQYTKELR